jgi:hypothetical protein
MGETSSQQRRKTETAILDSRGRPVTLLYNDDTDKTMMWRGHSGAGHVGIVDPDTGQHAQVEANGGLAINIQDQTTTALDNYFVQYTQAPTTLAVAASPGDYTITLTDATGFVAGNTVGLPNLVPPYDNSYFGTQLGAPAGAVITLDTPISTNMGIGNTVWTGNRSMNVDGSVTPAIFQIGPVGAATELEIDIVRIMGWIQDDVSMDDAKFGGISALTKGMVLRRNNADGTFTNYWNVKSNGEIRLLAFDANYASKAPSGFFGFNFRNTYGGQSKHGVVIRLATGQSMQVVVQDDLTDLAEMFMMAQGHIVTD